MDRWIKALQDQVGRIANAGYLPDPARFTDAPDDIARISQDLDALAVTFAEREAARQVLAHEVHHRVKNNLQIVTSLLKLQSRTITDPVCRQPLEQAHIRMSALALIHRLLYEQGDAASQSRIDINMLFAGLASQLRNAFRDRESTELEYRAQGQSISLDSAVPLTLFAVEAITNAYGHAFPDGRPGQITLNFVLQGERATLTICDDGVGFDPDGEAKSMGRQLLAAFAHQLGGTLTIKSATTTGTVVTLSYQART
jgi:two-component sensor histidine kinase